MTEVLRRQFLQGATASPLRREARGILLRWAGDDRDSTWLDDVLIVISELVHNVVRHTAAGAGELIISVKPGSVLVQVGDCSTRAPVLPAVDPARPGGRGLQLIQSLARQWGVRTCRAGKSVWAVLPSPAPA
ncbi:ATP-binding protein [Actinoplanes sp. RD1]|uniref:ATP-binding protein n=1 Tax=Actinoplanes sp. RD1 TaxID=3064538 RepID=UPI002742525E|nr:ATP-binding protein [Actinoplanes sp. RD1]